MKLSPLAAGTDASPGEYLFHEPTQQIVLCGRFDDVSGHIQAMGEGRLLYDEVKNFKKINLSPTERRDSLVRGCKKCKG
tara:strand:+ start:2033 stop:2269 length:237 start_codon:yes stop_codon:yes gene_type:complete